MNIHPVFWQRNPYASVAVLPAVLSSASDTDLILYCPVLFTARHSLLYFGGSELLCYSIYNLSTLFGEERANFSVDELLIFFMSFFYVVKLFSNPLDTSGWLQASFFYCEAPRTFNSI